MQLTDESFDIFAAKHYDIKKASTVDEFFDDLKRFQYLKKLINRYHNNGDLKTRLILNHIIILYNCFGPFTTVMLFHKLEGYHHYIIPFISFLGFLPDSIEYNGMTIKCRDIIPDDNIEEELAKI